MPDTNLETSNETDFLTPEQRLNAIAEILSTIALRAVNSNREEQEARTGLSSPETPVRSFSDELGREELGKQG